jgi:hypothetical protein
VKWVFVNYSFARIFDFQWVYEGFFKKKFGSKCMVGNYSFVGIFGF